MGKAEHKGPCLPDVLHVADVAKFLGLHEKTVYTYVREGKICIAAYKLSCLRFARRNDLALRTGAWGANRSLRLAPAG